MNTERLIKKIEDLKRIKIIAKERVIFKQHTISKLDRNILLNFEKIPIKNLAKKLKCHRSYIYAIINKYQKMLTKEEVQQTG